MCPNRDLPSTGYPPQLQQCSCGSRRYPVLKDLFFSNKHWLWKEISIPIAGGKY